VLSTGCFYVDPINQRPSIDITAESGDVAFRGSQVTVAANASDPENQQISFGWRIYACTDASTQDACDTEPFDSGKLASKTFTVPVMRLDQPVDVTGIRVILEAKDELGATAKPEQVLPIAIGDQAPTLEVGKTLRGRYVANTPVSLYAKYGDADDVLAQLALDWHVFTPAQDATFDLTDAVADPTDTLHLQKAKRFVPHVTGAWDVVVTVTDPLGMTAQDHIAIQVDPDGPPCITLYEPTAPLAAGSPPLPMSAPTLFSVPIVSDDLDSYPGVTNDPIFGTAQFSWSLKAPNASSFAPLGITANSVALDPAAYTVGDQLELRVDVADRNGTTLTCPDSDLTCAQNAGSGCIQRLTWRVEVR
jgi:hypothetical protein